MGVLTCQPNVVEYLVEKGADVNMADRNGQTALHLACNNADLEDVKALKQGVIKNGENTMELNSRNFGGNYRNVYPSNSCLVYIKLTIPR